MHMHIGSGTDLEHLSQVCGAMERCARQIGPSITTISAGGGLPIAYRPGEQLVDLEAYFRLWDAVRKRLAEAFGHPVRLEIEPGRYLVAESGYLLSQIRAVKQTSTRTFYILDAGFNNLARPILYGAYHPMSVATDNGIALERPLQDVVVAGPLCESGDVFTQAGGGRGLHAAAAGGARWRMAGDRARRGLRFRDGLQLQQQAPCCRSAHRRQEPLSRARRQTFEDLIRGESIPDYAAGRASSNPS